MLVQEKRISIVLSDEAAAITGYRRFILKRDLVRGVSESVAGIVTLSYVTHQGVNIRVTIKNSYSELARFMID